MLKQLKRYTNGARHQIVIQKNFLLKSNKIINSIGYKKFVGRSSLTGHITVRHKGGGCKTSYRPVNISNCEFIGILIGIAYDPFRNSFISCTFNLLTLKFFNTISIANVFPGSSVSCKTSSGYYYLGCRYSLCDLSAGSIICLVSTKPTSNAIFIRAGGTYGTLIQVERERSHIRLPSGKVINIKNTNYATLGSVSNEELKACIIGKAGKSRLMGIRPSVRGIAMNPVDHPHGGRSNGGMHPKTPWGKPTRGVLTANKKYEKK